MSEQTAADAAGQFTEMSGAIERNADSFAGAFVIVGPDGTTKKMLLITDAPEAALFWANVKTMCEMALAEIEQHQVMNPRQPQWR